jgi:hypothetical protein
VLNLKGGMSFLQIEIGGGAQDEGPIVFRECGERPFFSLKTARDTKKYDADRYFNEE